MLRRSRLFRDYEGVFSKATGLALALRPLDYWQLEHQGKKHENPFCALLAEQPKTLAVCLQAHQDMIDHTGELPRTVTCPFGLTETAVPVKLGSETIGYLRIGQVLRHTPAKSDTTKVTRELDRCGVRFQGRRIVARRRREGGGSERLSFLQGFSQGYRPKVHRLRRTGTSRRCAHPFAQSKPANQRDCLRRRLPIADPIQSDFQTRVRTIAERFPRASFFEQARWQSRLAQVAPDLGRSDVNARGSG